MPVKSTALTYGDYLEVEQQVRKFLMENNNSDFATTWAGKAGLFIQMFCMEEGITPDSLDGVLNSTKLGDTAVKFFEDAKAWLRLASPVFAGIK